MTTEFGVLLLHFGHTASKEAVVDQAPQLEEWGFNSVWTRDHLEFQPHGFEKPSTIFMEPFTTLTAIAAITTHLKVGTATTIPFRHPLVTSQLYGGLSAIAGPGRVIAGIGAGAPKKPFTATGIPYDQRFTAVKELAEILRLTWSTPNASYQGEMYQFENVTIDPHPPADTPIWYGGSTPASVRRALEYCDGWFPGRCPLKSFDKYLARVRKGAEEQGRHVAAAIIPCISIARSREEAVAAVDVEGLLEEAHERKFWDGPFETADDLDGILIAGTPDECIGEIKKFVDRDVDQLVFDFRLRPDDYKEQVAWLARDILPAVRELAAAKAAV
ncbi:MAG TPA: LLM class flavin-dependent oxidoreductase [Candidatus Dormibacteraeota bacterium]|nr:LLM class flavin-dependent oxidoreductase [Candidatus Dormibacteraeota bacterium]